MKNNLLWVFEMANNHQGSVEHAKLIVDRFSALAKKHKLRAAIKLQFRQLDSFIHPSFQNSDLKLIKRFSETRLSNQDFLQILEYIKESGLLTMVTPFDNESLDLFEEYPIDIIKVASCSVDDWPLLREIKERFNKPIIVSTAGATPEVIDQVANIFHGYNLTLMHCVGEYPTPVEHSNLQNIKFLMKRYDGIPVGFSTHESPTQTTMAPNAVMLGCTVIEKHVGVETDKIRLNAYSCTPEQMEDCIVKTLESVSALSGEPDFVAQQKTMRGLKRGIYFSSYLKKGTAISKDDIYLAMPLQDGQLDASSFFDLIGAQLTRDVVKNELVSDSSVEALDTWRSINRYAQNALKIMSDAKIPYHKDDDVELSAHRGIDEFLNTGATIINKVNREYCKKLIIMFPGQKHPEHFHVRKEEVFELLYGDCKLVLENKQIDMVPGKTYLIPRSMKHSFSSTGGCVVEEISTTHHKGDSYYSDETISKLSLNERKFKFHGFLQR